MCDRLTAVGDPHAEGRAGYNYSACRTRSLRPALQSASAVVAAGRDPSMRRVGVPGPPIPSVDGSNPTQSLIDRILLVLHVSFFGKRCSIK